MYSTHSSGIMAVLVRVDVRRASCCTGPEGAVLLPAAASMLLMKETFSAKPPQRISGEVVVPHISCNLANNGKIGGIFFFLIWKGIFLLFKCGNF